MDIKFVNRTRINNLRDPRIMMCADNSGGGKLTQFSVDQAMKELSIGANHFRVGQIGEAKAVFDRVLQRIPSLETETDRDQVRNGVANTFRDLGEITEAIRITNEIEDQSNKFGAFNDLSDYLLKVGKPAEAKNILLNYSAAVAREHDVSVDWERQSKIDQLLMVAEKLIQIEAQPEAYNILQEAISCLSAGDVGVSTSELEYKERAAILLLGLGKKEEAIHLVIKNWLPDNDLESLSPEEAQTQTQRCIDDHYIRFSQALKKARE